MTAVYLHNTLYGGQSLGNDHLSPHVRTTSTNSDATTVLTSIDHSHPSQPLLSGHNTDPMAPDVTAQLQRPHPHYNRARDANGLQFENKPVIPQQSGHFRRHHEEIRHQRLKIMHHLLEAIPPAWAIYNCARYFLAYTSYDSGAGRAASLALGLLTGVAFSFYACAFIIYLCRRQLIQHHIPPRRIFAVETILKALASAALFAPSVVSLVLLESWKNSASSELNVLKRCHVDIDVIWSTTKRQCAYSPWSVWLALSLLRIVVTLLFIVAYHATFFAYQRQSKRVRPFQRHRSRNLSESSQSSLPPVIPGPSLLGTHRHHLQALSNTSDSTLKSQSNSKYSLNYPLHPNGRSFTDEGPSGYSEQEVKDLFFPHDNSSITLHPPENSNTDLDTYRSLVSQVIQENEETIELARSDTSSDTDSGFFDHLDRPMYPANIGFDEFGRPYPPEFDVPVLNGLVRRMPTIESAGSREVSSIMTRPYSTDMETGSTRYSGGSRPPTRSNTRSFSEYEGGSHPSSRRNSAAGTANEMGELIPSHGTTSRPVTPGQTGFSYPSTGSYYTATSRRTVATTPLSFTAEPEEMEDTILPPGLGVDELGRQIKR